MHGMDARGRVDRVGVKWWKKSRQKGRSAGEEVEYCLAKTIGV